MMLFELKNIRRKAGLSQEEAADQLGVPIGTYRNWEQMKTMPRDRGELPRLARFFGVTVEDLFGEGLVTPGTLNEQYGTPEPQEPVYRVIDKRLESIERAYESMNENGRHVLHSVAVSLSRGPRERAGGRVVAVAAIYARYSSAGQREESIEDQVRVCTEAAERAGDNVVRVYQDRASTGTSVDHRHGFLQMVADGQRGAFEVLYVYKTDRFARNRYDSAVYKMRLRRAGVRVVSATERIEDGPDGILLESVLEGMAESTARTCPRTCGAGWTATPRSAGTTACARSATSSARTATSPWTRRRRPWCSGASRPTPTAWHAEICAEYSWVRTKMGKPLTVSMLSRMLRNEKYRGRYSYGGHVVEGGMPRIVSDELFYAVQRMLAAATRRRRGVMDYLLTGKLFDEEGHRYQSQSGHGKSGRKYTYYKCPATGHAVRQDALEAEVARGVAGILEADDGAVAAIVAMVLAEQDEAAAGDVAAMDAMRSRLAENAREQSRMVDLAAKTGAVDAVAAKMAELSEERGALERDLAEMERACPLLSGEEVEFWVRRVMGRRDPLEAVRLFVTRVVLDRARGEILVEFTFDGGRGGGGGGGEKPNPRPGDCPGGGSDRLRMAESWGFEPQTPFWGVLA